MGLRKIERSSSSSTYVNIADSFLLCFLTALVCSLFFFSSFWIIPSLQASSTMLSLLSSFSETTHSIFRSPKCVFIVGNLIVVLLIGESKIFPSETPDRPANDVGLFDGQGQNCRYSSICEKEDKRVSESCAEAESDDEWEMSLGSEELSKRADDFIARVNMQRKIEATMLPYCCEWTTMKKKYRKRYCLK